MCLCVCVCECVWVCVCVWRNEHVLRDFKKKKEEKYSKCQMPVCGYVCMCVCVRACVVRVWCVDGSWTDRSDKTMARFEPRKGVQLDV